MRRTLASLVVGTGLLIASVATIAQESQPAPGGGMMGPGMGGMMVATTPEGWARAA